MKIRDPSPVHFFVETKAFFGRAPPCPFIRAADVTSSAASLPYRSYYHTCLSCLIRRIDRLSVMVFLVVAAALVVFLDEGETMNCRLHWCEDRYGTGLNVE